MMQKRVHKCVLGMAGAWMNDQSGWLVQDEKVIVLVQDV
jgi:hypothetical protein